MSTAKSAKSRLSLVEQVARGGEDLGSAGIFFHQAAASVFGLNATDTKAIGLLRAKGSLTSSEIAAEIGLTRGAVTSIVDRLVEKGFVQRIRQSDRRKTLITLTESNLDEKEKIYHPMMAAMAKLLSRYSKEELFVILDYQSKSTKILRDGASALIEASLPVSPDSAKK